MQGKVAADGSLDERPARVFGRHFDVVDSVLWKLRVGCLYNGFHFFLLVHGLVKMCFVQCSFLCRQSQSPVMRLCDPFARERWTPRARSNGRPLEP